jgi:hypothetical protein
MKTKRPTSRKRKTSRDLARLEDIPNVGPAIAADLPQLGIADPADLLDRDPCEMYDDLCRLTGQRHDPCRLDTFIAAVRFMQGERKKPSWKYTAERKKVLAARAASIEKRAPLLRSGDMRTLVIWLQEPQRERMP